MCKILKVNRASYYHWIQAGCVVKKVDKQLNELIKSIFIFGRNNYGTRRIADKLKELYGLIVSRKRISAIMKDLNLKVNIKRRYKNTTDYEFEKEFLKKLEKIKNIENEKFKKEAI